MKQLKLSGKALVIRMDRDEVRVARMNIGKADPQILESAVMPTPEGAMIDGMIENQFQMEEVLNEITSRPEFKRTKKVVFSLCTSQVITETVTVPAVGDKKMAKMLEANMDMYFPVEISDRHIVWHVIRRNNEAKEVTVQLWAIPTQMLAGYYALANACGLSVAAIDYCGNSMVNAVGALFADDTAASTGLQPQTFFGIQIGGKKKEKPKKEKKAKKQKPKKEKKPLFKKKQTEPELTAEDLTKEEPVFDGLYGEEAEALRKEEAAAAAETVNEVDTDIYLMLESEHLIVTFVQEGNVKMQRVLLCGYNIENELDEIQMMIEYFSTTEHASFGQFRVILCGKLSGDPVLVGKVESVLDLPVHTFDFQKGPGWCLCFGAAQSGLDYGIAALNQFKGPSKKVAAQWQWGVLALAGLLLVLSVVSFMGSRTIWKTTITSLEDQERILRIQEAANAGYADRFYQYQYEYSSYSNDWDVLHKSIRTYNDNLSKMLKEVERTLPKNTDVVTIGIANEGLGLQFACPDKDTAAYIIIALRKLEYATLDGISNLTVGPGTSAQDMLPSLKAKTEATLGSGMTTVPEQAPTEGSGID
ncbi:MAG: pilus assembly protein PilM, partial [Firmicutes bacterium]|nr:pilus assembly protein PilM [Bacillota bacterium]